MSNMPTAGPWGASDPDHSAAEHAPSSPSAATTRATTPLSLDTAMDRAVELALRGPAHGPNPRVGCVILGPDGDVLGEGWHKGAGTAHAEPAAIANAQATGADLSDATAVVTLEPCSHTGRTPPCVDALTHAGVSHVIYAVADPGKPSSGGGEVLMSRGINATLAPHAGATELTRRWHRALSLGRPYVIAKWAATLDGRMAAADGTAFWITGEQAREHAHVVRSQVDAIAVGTGTVMADDPQLSARPTGVDDPHQPLRVVIGSSPTTGKQVWRDTNAVGIATHDPLKVLAELAQREVRTLVVEGGPTVLSAFFRAGVVDEVNAYIAPAVLGSGPSVVEGLGIATMAQALRGMDVTHQPLGADILVTAHFTGGA